MAFRVTIPMRLRKGTSFTLWPFGGKPTAAFTSKLIGSRSMTSSGGAHGTAALKTRLWNLSFIPEAIQFLKVGPISYWIGLRLFEQ